MSRSIELGQWNMQRKAFEGRAEDILLDQQKLFRLAQALSKHDFDLSRRALQGGAAIDLPLWFDDQSPGAVPGASRWRPEALAKLPCATMLAIFAVRGDHESVDWLLRAGANPQQVFADNRDAAWLTMASSQVHFHGLLLGSGALPNLRISDGSRTTRLMAAVGLSNPTMVDHILARRADPNAYDVQGRTPLHVNFSMSPYTPNDMSIAEMLLAAGANPNAEDLSGMPPHLLATEDSARAVLSGHELRITTEMEMARLRAAAEAELQANTPPVADPADPDTPQIQRKPVQFKPKPPRL
jgi:hypothetical protein